MVMIWLLTFHQKIEVVLAYTIDTLQRGAIETMRVRINFNEILGSISTYLVDIQSRLPVWISCSLIPHVDEFISDTISCIDIVDEFDDLGIFRLIEEDKRNRFWILRWQDELEADWSTLVIDLNRKLSSNLDAVVFLSS